MSEGFRRQVFDFAERKATPIIRFEKGMRKDDVMHKRLRKFKRGRVSSLSASPRRRLACRAPSAKASGRPRAPSRGLITPRPWLSTIIFTAWTKTSEPSSSSSAPTFPTRASSASTGTSISTGSWPGAASNSKRSTTGSCAVRTRPATHDVRLGFAYGPMEARAFTQRMKCKSLAGSRLVIAPGGCATLAGMAKQANSDTTEIQRGNRAVRHRELPACREHGLQGRLSPMGALTLNWRLKKGGLISQRSHESTESLERDSRPLREESLLQ